MKVEDLVEREEYQFRIKAVNKAGPSQPSEATDWHLVKHRKREERWDGSRAQCPVSDSHWIRIGILCFVLILLD